MTLTEIKTAIDNGVRVFWSNPSYEVIKSKDDYLIKHSAGNCIGLTWADNKTLNGKEEDFYTLNDINKLNN